MIVPKNPHLNLSAIADSANASAGGGSPDGVLESFSIYNLAAGIYDRMIRRIVFIVLNQIRITRGA